MVYYNSMITNTPLPAIAVEQSGDTKLSKDGSISATWVSQGSCPKTCSFYKNGCYGEHGKANLTTIRLNSAQELGKYNPEQLAKFEAQAISTLSGKRPLRLHILGDCRTQKSARIVSKAANQYIKTYNKPVWTYTHAPNVPRSIWGAVSVLRSCENVAEIEHEHNRGYACVLVVPEPHKTHRAYDLGNGFRGVPCPQQTGKQESCAKCKLCWNDKALRDNKLVILFAPDGSTSKRIKNALKVLPVVQNTAKCATM